MKKKILLIVVCVAIIIVGIVLAIEFLSPVIGGDTHTCAPPYYPNDEMDIELVHTLEGEIEAAADKRWTTRGKVAAAVKVIERQKERGCVEYYRNNGGSITVRFSEGITYMFYPNKMMGMGSGN